MTMKLLALLLAIEIVFSDAIDIIITTLHANIQGMQPAYCLNSEPAYDNGMKYQNLLYFPGKADQKTFSGICGLSQLKFRVSEAEGLHDKPTI